MTATETPLHIPDAEFVGHFEPGEPEWVKARRTRVGGSEIAPIMALSPWDSYFSVWHRKRGSIGEVEETPQMRWGKKLEALICDEFAACHPELQVLTVGSWVHRDRPWQLASPDRVAVDIATGELIVVEAKTDRFDEGWGETGTDEIPPHYRCQVMHYMDTLGLRRAVIPVLFAGSDYREYELAYDPAEAETYRHAADAFVRTLIDNVLPDVDKHTATYAALRQLHPDIDDVNVEIPMPLALAYLDAQQAVRDADAAKQMQTNLIADALGNGRRAVDPLGAHIAIRVPGRGDNPPFIRPAQTSRSQT